MAVESENRSHLTRFAWLSIGVAALTIGLKAAAYLFTGSVGLLSDALESLVNLAGALMALGMLTIAARPADEDHAFGHSKAEYFSSGVEGSLILIAAASIAYTAVGRLLNPKPLEQVGIGLAISLLAALANLGTAVYLGRAAKRYNSITLAANSHHLMTDVWTSGGVLVGVGLVAATGWQVLDPIIALVVAVNIIWTGVGIMRSSVSGLMDSAVSAEDMKIIEGVLDAHREGKVEFHALRTRQSGALKFISLHVLVPGSWTVHHGHQLVSHIEEEIHSAIPDSVAFTHLESLDDPASWDDVAWGSGTKK